MNTQRLFIAVVALFVAGAAYLFWPSSEERLAMMVRDGDRAEVRAELQRLYASGDRRASVVAALAKSIASRGDFVRAAQLMEQYASQRPGDAVGLTELADMHMAADNTSGALTALARAAIVDSSRDRLSKLLALYRLHGRYDDELALLVRHQSNSALAPLDLVRLAERQAAGGDVASAITTLERLELRSKSAADGHERARLLMFELLVDSARIDEAVTLARGWLTTWRKPWLAMQLVRRVAASTPDLGVDALVAVVADIHPETRFYLARTLAESGRRAPARRMLETWAAASPDATAAEVGNFVFVAGLLGDPTLLWRAFAGFLAKPAALEAQANFAEALVEQYGVAALAPLRSRLSMNAISRRPLLAARIAVLDRNGALAMQYLQKVNLASLSPEERKSWFELVIQAAPEDRAFGFLAAERRQGRLPVDLLPLYVRLAERVGQLSERSLALAEIGRLARRQ